MSADPVLVLQLHRLGDIILTFPLLADLRQRYPASPVWLAAEPAFYRDLAPLVPGVRFFPPKALPSLGTGKYAAIFNLSNRPDASTVAHNATAPEKYGPLAAPEGLHVAGYWQLYRLALTGNNRHNAFHWADLFRLDSAFPLPLRTGEPFASPGSNRIGLFVGASEPAKRPDEAFWISLAGRLAAAGFIPILLGGPAEKDIGAHIAIRARIANFCGKTSITQLAAIIRSLDLLITPDTGPMHLADRLGCQVLNLSMGNVHAAETGPLAPGQWILRPHMSCVGCWSCSRPRLYCRMRFKAQSVAAMAAAIMAGESLPKIPGLEILRPGRDHWGLYTLQSVSAAPSCREMLDAFWKAAFISFNQPAGTVPLEAAARNLATSFPAVVRDMRASFGRMLAIISQARKKSLPVGDFFWKMQPAHSRIFAGHAQMFLQNADFSNAAMIATLDRLASLQEVFARAT